MMHYTDWDGHTPIEGRSAAYLARHDVRYLRERTVILYRDGLLYNILPISAIRREGMTEEGSVAAYIAEREGTDGNA